MRFASPGMPLLVLFSVCLAVCLPRPAAAQSDDGTVVLVGDVLPLNKQAIWSRITELAPELVIIAAASDRPKQYGGYARKALQRHGAFAHLLPLALDPAEFGVDYREAVSDPGLVDRIRSADGVFFVGGAPQRLARLLFAPDGSATPMASAIVALLADGGVVVGGIPGATGVSTGVDALDALERGRLPTAQLFSGLGLIAKGWFVDQHMFSAGRFAETLVAMRQLGIERGIGVGANTAAFISGNRMEVVGDEGVVLLDLSAARSAADAQGAFELRGASLSYLEHGDRVDLASGVISPSEAKLAGFPVEPVEPTESTAAGSAAADNVTVENLLARGRMARLLHEALDGERPETTGLVFPEGAKGGDQGFSFRFFRSARTTGWLSFGSGFNHYTIIDLSLDVSRVARSDALAGR